MSLRYVTVSPLGSRQGSEKESEDLVADVMIQDGDITRKG
jgi:hypothetical protein